MTDFINAPWEIISDTSGCFKVVDAFDNSILPSTDDIEIVRIIAAAPDLLEACEKFVEAYEKSLQLEKTDVAVRMAKIAIERARGE